LKSNDENERKNAAKKLQELKEKSNDPSARQAADEALKERESGGGTNAGQKSGESQGKTSSSADNQKPSQDPKTGAKGSEAKSKSPSEKNDQSPDPKPDQNGAAGQGQNQSPKSGEGANRPGEKSTDQQKGGQQPGQPGAGSQPGGSGGPGQQGGSEPSGKPSSPGDAGVNRNPPPPEKGEDELSTPDNRFLQRPGDLQLEEFKKKVNKDVLRRLNMTEEEYQRFLKAYEEMLKRQPPPAVGKQDMASPVKGNRILPNQAVRQVESGVPSKVGNLERVGPGQPPPEYREAFKDFTQRLSEMEKTRDRK
jgi:hypothetical protein